jgi:hypothetical protein
VPVIGTQVTPATGDWRLTNGLVRVEGSGTGLKVNWFSFGSVWGAQHTFNLTLAVGGNILGEEPNIRILRNSPEQVIVRLAFKTSTINSGAYLLDVNLRRGARVVRCYLSWVAAADAVTVAHSTNVACTALTAGGIRATANDADTNRFVLMCSKTMTQDLVNGKLTQATSTFQALDFGIGAEISAPAPSYNTSQDLVYQYLAAQGERMSVVGR